MEFRDLKSQYTKIKSNIDDAINKVISNANFIAGKEVRELEEQLAGYVGVKHCITCANGTDALQLALMAWNIGSGDAIFVPDFTFFSSGEVVSAVGATPVFVDIDKDTYNISVESLEQAIQYVLNRTSLKPKVIVAVDLFGQPADFLKIHLLAEKYDLYVLEDGAQGFGGMIGNRKACGFGDIATTSFFPAKPLGCYGDGGAIFTNDDQWAEMLRSFCVHGKGQDKYDNVRIGMNSRLDTIQAVILKEKLKIFDKENERCNTVATEYTRRLDSRVKTPVVAERMQSSWAQYTICLKDTEQRDRVIKKLQGANIPSAIYYKKPMHTQRAFGPYQFADLSYDITDDISKRCLSLPMHAYLEDDDMNRVIENVIEGLA